MIIVYNLLVNRLRIIVYVKEIEKLFHNKH